MVAQLNLPFDVAIETRDVKRRAIGELLLKADFVLRRVHRLQVERGRRIDEVLTTRFERQTRTARQCLTQGRHLSKLAVLDVHDRAVGNRERKAETRADLRVRLARRHVGLAVFRDFQRVVVLVAINRRETVFVFDDIP